MRKSAHATELELPRRGWEPFWTKKKNLPPARRSWPGPLRCRPGHGWQAPRIHPLPEWAVWRPAFSLYLSQFTGISPCTMTRIPTHQRKLALLSLQKPQPACTSRTPAHTCPSTAREHHDHMLWMAVRSPLHFAWAEFSMHVNRARLVAAAGAVVPFQVSAACPPACPPACQNLDGRSTACPGTYKNGHRSPHPHQTICVSSVSS